MQFEEKKVEEEEEEQFEKYKVKQKKAATLKIKNVSALGAYEQIEAKLPLQILDIREFEGRIKKLVYDKDTISIRQL
jgi:hypothetical protein